MSPLRHTRHATPPALLIRCLLLPATQAQAAPKTDTIILSSGDTIICEVKELSYGKLLVKTDDMGTLSIEWDEVARVISYYLFLAKLIARGRSWHHFFPWLVKVGAVDGHRSRTVAGNPGRR